MSRIKKYDGFINENMDQARSLIAKKMAAFDKLKSLLSKNLGYIGKFTEYLLHKLCDRMYKIYTENKVVYNDGTRSTGVRKDTFEFKMAFLGAILGRKEDCPDYEEIVKRMKPDMKSYYPGLFSTYIDISETYIRFDNMNVNFPIELIEVKDYPESKVYISKYGLLNQIPKLLEHLKGKQLTLNVRRDDLKSDFKYGAGADYEAKLTPDTLRVYNLLRSFPQRIYKDTFKVDGNLKVVVK